MAVWKIEIFDNKTDPQPSKTGYVEADTNIDAAEAAANFMGLAQRADVVPAPRVTEVPRGQIIWVP